MIVPSIFGRTICCFLSLQTIYKIKRVCKQFDFVTYVQYINFEGDELPQRILDQLHINLTRVSIRCTNIINLKKFVHIKELILYNVTVTKMPQYCKKLKMERCNICDDLFEKKYEDIKILYDKGSTKSFKVSCGIKMLHIQNCLKNRLSFNHAISLIKLRIDHDLKGKLDLSGCSNLQKLIICDNGFINDEMFGLPNPHLLKTIKATAVCDKALARCTSLKSLTVHTPIHVLFDQSIEYKIHLPKNLVKFRFVRWCTVQSIQINVLECAKTLEYFACTTLNHLYAQKICVQNFAKCNYIKKFVCNRDEIEGELPNHIPFIMTSHLNKFTEEQLIACQYFVLFCSKKENVKIPVPHNCILQFMN